MFQMEISPRRAWKKLRRPGWWLLEIQKPRTGFGRRIHRLCRALRSLKGLIPGSRRVTADGTFVAFYDLGHWPITFDFLWFMVAADLERQRLGFRHLHFVFVPGSDWEAGPEVKSYYEVVDGAARRQRVYDVLVPATALLSATAGLTLAGSRAEASRIVDRGSKRVFPDGYSPELPGGDWPYYKMVMDASRSHRTIPPLQAPQGARDWVKRWREAYCDGRPYVTITLRHFGYTPVRNSNLGAWGDFARELEGRGFCPVIVPETHMTLDALPSELQGLQVFTESAWQLHLRSALYEGAYLNLGVNNGPLSLCILNLRCRYIIFKMIIEGETVAGLKALLERGIDPRQPLPFASRFQRWVVEPDTLPTIRSEFEAMCRSIEEAEDSVTQPAGPEDPEKQPPGLNT